MSVDSELDGWREEWQSHTEVLPDLAAKVRRQTRFMRFMLAAEVVITVGMGGGSIVWAVQDSHSDVVVLAAAVWIFLAAAWAFAIQSRRGIWVPEARTTAAFLDISVRRCRSSLSAAIFGTALYFAEIVFCLGWIYHRNLDDGPLSLATFLRSGTCIAVAIGTVVFVGMMIWYRAKKRSELACLLELQARTTGS